MSESTVSQSPVGHVFLSYASQDAAVVQQVCAALEAAGLRCWMAPRDVRAGGSYAAAIVEAINSCQMLVLLLSGNAIESSHVLREVERASSKKRPVLTVRLDDSALPAELEYFLSVNHWLDASGGRMESMLPALVAAVRGQPTEVHAATMPGAARSGSRALRNSGANRAVIVLGAVVALGAAYALAQRFWLNSSQQPTLATSSAPVAAVAQPAAPRTAIAVMPFANLTGDANKEYLGDGMAEELIDTLAKVPGLRVPARTSTFAYKGRNTDVREIARELNVGTVLEGSVRAADKRIRITAQLINAQDGLHLWSETYDEDFTDIFMVQDKLAAQIAKALLPNLSVTAQAALTQVQPTQDAEAYRLYLQGMALNDGGLQKETAARAIEVFTQAIARDPKFARAYRGLGTARLNLAHAGDETIHAEQEAEARKAFAQGVALDPSLAGVSRANALRPVAAEVELRAALASQPNEPQVHFAYAPHLAALGHLREAIGHVRSAQALKPANAEVAAMAATHYSSFGEDEVAQNLAQLAVKLGWRKDFGPLVGVGVRRAMAQHRLDDLDRFLKVVDPKGFAQPEYARLRAALQKLYTAAADPAQRATAIAMRNELFPRQPLTLASAGPCLAGYRRYVEMEALDAAFELANQCRDQVPDGLQRLMIIETYTKRMRSFRRDPRFQSYAARFSDAMPYWKEYGPPDDCELANGKLVCR